jgi:hypothetical protein
MPAQAPVSGISYPFGARVDRYVAGILPTQSASTMDAVLTAQYDAWKAKAVVSANSIVSGGYAVQFSNPAYLAVSEGMGYGMLLAVLFAGHDPQARTLFDGLLAVVRARPAYAGIPRDPNGKYLMDWRLNANGTSGGDGWNAMDGDLDIAMALLMADRQWGSAGTWNYLQEGKNTIGAIKSYNMKPDGTTRGLANATTSRTSDYMFGHFRAFQKATGDSFWSTVIDRSYYLANLMQTSYSSAGLMPDFIVNTGGELKAGSGPYPSPGGWGLGDGNYDAGKFWWNACRNPWRFSSDYLLSGDARTKQLTTGLINFFKKQAGSSGDVTQIGTGYALDGTRLAWTSGWNAAAFMGPIMAGACVDSSYQAFLDAMWTWNVGHRDIGYYDGEIQLLSLVVASGNWWTTGKAA